MATWLLTASRGNGDAVFSAGFGTRFVPPASNLTADENVLNNVTVRGRVRYAVERLFVRVTANGLTAASSVTFQESGVDTSVTVSIPAGMTGVFRDDTNTASTTIGGQHSTRIQIGSTGTSMVLRLISYLYTDGVTQRIFIATHAAPALSWPSGADEFCSLTGGTLRRSGDETRFQYTLRAPSTVFTNMRIRVPSNTVVEASVMHIRKNGANGALTLTIPALTSGDFEDTTNSETFGSGDQANYRLNIGGGAPNALTTSIMQLLLDGAQRITSTHQIGSGTSGGNLAFNVIEGHMGGTLGSESFVQQEARNAFQARNYFVRILSNTTNGEFRSNLRVNGANSALGVIVPTGLTGTFEDGSNRVDVSALDDVNVSKDASAASSGVIEPVYIGFSYIEAPTPVGPPQEPVPGHTSWGIGRRVEMLPY